MWKKELIKNKIYAVILMCIGALVIPWCDGDATFFLFSLMMGIPLFFAKENWIYEGEDNDGTSREETYSEIRQKAKTTTYNLTKEQLNIAVREQVGKELERIKQEATDDAVNTAMVLLLTLPLEVLMDHYWTKTYAKRIPRFTELVLEYYERWQNGELDMDKLKEDLWEYGGVKLVEGEGETT